MSYATKLAAVEARIASILSTGQSMSDDGSSLTEADLGQLHNMEKYYSKMAAKEARTSRRSKAWRGGIS